MKTIHDYMIMQDNFLLKTVIFDMFKDEFNERVNLSGHRGRYWDDMLNWYDRNVEFRFESTNDKYTGFHLIMWNADQKQIYIKNELLQLSVKNFNHALNIVRKYMIENKTIKNKITL